jgi:hypothetical protein
MQNQRQNEAQEQITCLPHDDDNDGSAAQGGEENGAASPTRRISFAPLPPRRSTRVSVPPERFANVNFDKIARNLRKEQVNKENSNEDAESYVEFAMLTGEVSEMQSDPTSEKEARSGPNREKWLAAEKEEFTALMEEDVAELVDRPHDATVLPSKFVYKTKTTENGDVARHKARFVPLGCCDPWKKLKETFSPTLRYATLRVIIALAALLGVIIHQLDVKTAFLNGILTTRVYVEQPTGFEQGNREKKVWRLKKALYGLVEAPRLWYETLNKVLTEFGFTRITGDPCLYVLHRGLHIVLLGVFVDDFLICSTSEALVKEVKDMLKARFKTKDLGPARWILGMKLVQGPTEYALDQNQYLKAIIKRFNEYLHKGKRATRTPLPTKMDVRRAKEDVEVVGLPYRELLGSIGHLAIGTRLDISFAVSLLSRFVSKPELKDWNAAVHAVKYLQGQPNNALSYPKSTTTGKFDANLLSSNGGVNGAVDSDFANDPDTSKSVGGYIVRLGQTAVSWRSKLLPLVTTSTCHAEYIAAFECAREIVWLRMLLKQIGFNISDPSMVLEDNAAAKMTAESIGISDANKHVKVKFHWLREQIQDKQIKLTTVPSKNNPSDALTKAPTVEMLKVMTEWSRMRSCETQLDQGG